VADMDRVPDAVIVIDLKTEAIALNEADRLETPIVGLVDTNCDPTPVDYVVPGNDDAIRSCELIISTLGEVIEQGASAWRTEEERRRAEEERRRAEEEQRKREAEQAARAEAEAKSAEGQAPTGSGEGGQPAAQGAESGGGS
jgi:small subunit ribosomal protein S2